MDRAHHAHGLHPAAAASFLLVLSAACRSHDAERSAATPVQQDLGMLELERQGPRRVRAGEEFEYQIVLRNDTDHALHHVVVHEDTLAQGFEILAASPEPAMRPMSPGPMAVRTVEAGYGAAGAPVPTALGYTWQLGDLEPGERRVIDVRARAGATGELRSCVTADWRPSVCETIEVVAPDLAFLRSIAPQEIYACDELELTYEIRNTGTAAARNVRILESVPQWLAIEGNRREVDLLVDEIEPGETVHQTVTLKPNRPGIFESRALVRANGGQLATDLAAVRILQPELELSVDGPAEEFVERTLAYDVTVTNTSPDPARDVVVELDLDEAIDDLSVSSQRFDRDENTLRIGRLEAGESRSFRLAFDADQAGTLTSTVRAAAYCVAPIERQLTTQIRGIPAIRLEVVDKTDPVRVGDSTVYEVRVVNQGSAEDVDVQLNATIPRGMEFVDARGGSELQLRDQTLVFQPIPSLAPGEDQSWLINMRALEPGSVRFSVQMTSEANAVPILEQEPTTLFE